MSLVVSWGNAVEDWLTCSDMRQISGLRILRLAHSLHLGLGRVKAIPLTNLESLMGWWVTFSWMMLDLVSDCLGRCKLGNLWLWWLIFFVRGPIMMLVLVLASTLDSMIDGKRRLVELNMSANMFFKFVQFLRVFDDIWFLLWSSPRWTLMVERWPTPLQEAVGGGGAVGAGPSLKIWKNWSRHFILHTSS